MTSATLTRRSTYRAVAATDNRPVAIFLYTRILLERLGPGSKADG